MMNRFEGPGFGTADGGIKFMARVRRAPAIQA